MTTEDVTGSLTSQIVLKNIKTGQVVLNSIKPFTAAFTKNSDKVSVNTGTFVPGIYRINPYTVYEESLDANRVTWVDEAIDGGTYYCVDTLSGDIGPYLAYRAKNVATGITSNFGSLPDRALQKAYSKLGQSEAGMGETLGELRETLSLLRNPFKGFRDFLYNTNYRRLGLLNKLFQYARNGQWVSKGERGVSRIDAAKAAADTWLEFRYGLMPLVYTVQDLVDLANKQMGALDASRIRTKRAVVKSESSVSFLNSYYGATLGYTELMCNLTGTDKITCTACVQYRLLGLPSLADLLGLSPKFLPETAWELTRLSFVVDWWFDVGQWLGSLRIDPKYQVLGNTVGKRVSRRVSTNIDTRCSSIANAPKTTRGDFFSYGTEYYSRVINQSLPLSPLFKPEVNNVKHTVDALALILQPVLGKIRRN